MLASATQATTDPKPSSLANQLVYHAEGYYTYTFSTNIIDPSKTNGVTFEPGKTHRIAIQRDGFRPLEWDVTIEAGQVIPYRGVLDRQ